MNKNLYIISLTFFLYYHFSFSLSLSEEVSVSFTIITFLSLCHFPTKSPCLSLLSLFFLSVTFWRSLRVFHYYDFSFSLSLSDEVSVSFTIITFLSLCHFLTKSPCLSLLWLFFLSVTFWRSLRVFHYYHFSFSLSLSDEVSVSFTSITFLSLCHFLTKSPCLSLLWLFFLSVTFWRSLRVFHYYDFSFSLSLSDEVSVSFTIITFLSLCHFLTKSPCRRGLRAGLRYRKIQVRTPSHNYFHF